jgi:hypothetical protein
MLTIKLIDCLDLDEINKVLILEEGICDLSIFC